MASIHDVPVDKLLLQVKEDLKTVEVIKAPIWAAFVKTGMSRQRPPVEPDWWHMRTASVMRKISLLGPIGVSKLRRYYGGKKNRGNKPEHFFKGSGNIIRKVLQQLDKAGLTRQVEVQGHKGRILTPKGVSLLDKAATKVQHSFPKEKLVKAAPAPKAPAAPKVEAPTEAAPVPEQKEAAKAEQ